MSDRPGPSFGALDLGTNNCRLLVARPRGAGFRVVDAFSRIVRLGEGVAQSGRLSEEAVERTISALRVCAGKLRRGSVGSYRAVATEACRRAENRQAFIDRVNHETGLSIEIISPAEEVQLALDGCTPLFDRTMRHVLLLDIGGGSTELIWVRLDNGQPPALAAWHLGRPRSGDAGGALRRRPRRPRVLRRDGRRDRGRDRLLRAAS